MARPIPNAAASSRTGSPVAASWRSCSCLFVSAKQHHHDASPARGIKLSLGGQVYDPTDPMGKMFFNVLATFAEFEVDLLRMRTREGMAVARAKGRLKAENRSYPTNNGPSWAACTAPAIHHHRPRKLFNISRPAVYRTIAAVETVLHNPAGDNGSTYLIY